jgi:hypothetical protein
MKGRELGESRWELKGRLVELRFDVGSLFKGAESV